MKTSYLFLLSILLISSASGQVQIALDNGSANFTTTGTWITAPYANAYEGSATYKRKGDGNSVARWQTTLTWAAPYTLEMYIRYGPYAEDARCLIHTTTNDSLILVNQDSVETGWYNIGVFDLPENAWVQLNDYWEKHGRYVYADAIRMSLNAALYSISGTVEFSDANVNTPALLQLYRAGSEKLYIEKSLLPDQRNYIFDDIPEGWYKLVCTAWGYESVVEDSVHLLGSDITGLNLVMDPMGGPRYSISGLLLLDDTNPTVYTRIKVYPFNYPLPAAADSVLNDQTYQFSDLPEGTYRLEFQATGYLTDVTTYAAVVLSGSDVSLDPLMLYHFFKFAWISDSHIGAGTDAQLQSVINNIKSIQDDLDFVIHTGDISEKGLNSEFSQYKSLVNSCQIPVWNIPGNHDTKWSESGMLGFRNAFGSTRFSFETEGFKIIGLNSAIPLRGGGGYFDPVDLAWLDNVLSAMPDANMPVIIAWHIPSDFLSIYNYWQMLDLLKKYNTVLVLVGHGHSNQIYDFEGIPGVMTLDTYSATSGFNIVTVSRKEITVQTFYSGTGLADPWFVQDLDHVIQPEIQFTNLNDDEVISGSRNVQIHVSESMAGGSYDLVYDTSNPVSLSGSGQDWNFNLSTLQLENGYHTVQVTYQDADNKTYSRTLGFFAANSYPVMNWRYDAGAEVLTAPQYDEDQVYVGTSDGRLLALNLGDGSLVWTFDQAGGGIFSTPTIKGDTVYTGSADGKLYALNAATGSILWSYDAIQSILNPITVIDTLVYFAANNKFIALSLNSRLPVWTYTTTGMIEAKPAIAGDVVIFGCWDKYVHAVNRFTGTMIWKWYRNSSFYYAPAAAWPALGTDRIFITDPERYLSAINLTSGMTIWSGAVPEAWESVGISEDKIRVYMRSLDGNLYAFSATSSTQSLLWSAPADYGWDSTPSMPVEKNGILYTGSKKGFVIALQATTGQILWKYWLGHTYISTVTPVSNAQVLAAGLDGSVMLISGDPALGVETGDKQDIIPLENKLYDPYPNPFNNTVTIRYTLREKQEVCLQIFNIIGQKIFEFEPQVLEQGEYRWYWYGQNAAGYDMSSGLYFILLKGEDFQSAAKILLIK